MNEESRYEKGLKNRAEVFGAEGEERRGEFAAASPAFARFVTENIYGELYERKGMNPRTRETVILSILCALGRDREFEHHAKAALNVGMSKEDIQEIIMVCALYAGAPNAVGATEASLRVFRELGI